MFQFLADISKLSGAQCSQSEQRMDKTMTFVEKIKSLFAKVIVFVKSAFAWLKNKV
jgi:hypothetical protein